MGDDENGTAAHQVIHTFLNDSFGTGIDAGSSFIQDQYRRVRDGGPGDGQQLTLSLGELFTVTGEHSVISVGKHLDELIGMGQSGGCIYFTVGGIQLTVADVLFDGSGEQVCILQYGSFRPVHRRTG